LAGGAQVLDEEGDLANALFEAQVAEVNEMIDQWWYGIMVRSILHTAIGSKHNLHQQEVKAQVPPMVRNILHTANGFKRKIHQQEVKAQTPPILHGHVSIHPYIFMIKCALLNADHLNR
jgi:hypothetical protein